MNSIMVNKIIITSDLAHFKIPMTSKIHKTYSIPPVSTVIGILKNVYGEDIDNFTFGYFIEFDGIHKEINRVYKEVNVLRKNYNVTEKGDRFKTDLITLEYLINPRLIVYTDLNSDLKLNDVLNLGKTDCLAKLNIQNGIVLSKQYKEGFNQYTPKNFKTGIIKRINTETKYNESKGYYDIFSELLRENETFESYGFYDEEEENNIILWNWKKGGKIDVID